MCAALACNKAGMMRNTGAKKKKLKGTGSEVGKLVPYTILLRLTLLGAALVCGWHAGSPPSACKDMCVWVARGGMSCVGVSSGERVSDANSCRDALGGFRLYAGL